MNYIFLDIDGVLNSDNHALELYKKTKKQRSMFNFPFDWECLENLNKLVKDTNSNIILSSSWRGYQEGEEKLHQLFRFYDIDDKWIGNTGVMWNSGRDREIMGYIWNHPCDHFVVLDDGLWMSLLDYSVWVNSNYGLTNDDVEKAKRILKKEHKFNR